MGTKETLKVGDKVRIVDGGFSETPNKYLDTIAVVIKIWGYHHHLFKMFDGYMCHLNPSRYELLTTIQQEQLQPESPLDIQVGGSHYKDMKIQPIEFAVANKLNSCQTLALRYITRKKGDKEKILEDRRKAIHVIQMEIDFIEKGEISFD